MNTTLTEKLYNRFLKYLDVNELKYGVSDSERKIVFITFDTDDFPVNQYIEFDDNRKNITVKSPMQFKANPKQIQEFSVAVAIANETLQNGRFDVDVSTGEIVFHLCVYYSNTDLHDDVFEYILSFTNFAIDRYNDKFFLVLNNGITVNEFYKFANQIE